MLFFFHSDASFFPQGAPARLRPSPRQVLVETRSNTIWGQADDTIPRSGAPAWLPHNKLRPLTSPPHPLNHPPPHPHRGTQAHTRCQGRTERSAGLRCDWATLGVHKAAPFSSCKAFTKHAFPGTAGPLAHTGTIRTRHHPGNILAT